MPPHVAQPLDPEPAFVSPQPVQESLATAFRLSDAYTPWAHQIEFHSSGAKYRLMVGSFGSGKSKPLLWEAVMHCLEHPGVNAIILRKTMPDLKRTVIDKFKTDIPREIYDRYHETDHIVYFKKVAKRDSAGELVRDSKGDVEYLQSKLFFAACEKEKDIGNFLSTEYVFIGFEELGEFPFFIWDALAGRNRCTIPGTRPCMAAATNPMGIGWSWIKKIFCDHKPFAGMNKEAYRPSDYEFFHSTIDQNPILIKDKEYIRTLEASPNRDRIRWGALDAVSGQYFENWDPQRHVRPRSDFIFESWQPTWIGWDYGFSHWACMVWMTKAILRPRFLSDKPKLVNVVTRCRFMQNHTPEDQTKALIGSIPPRMKEGTDEQVGFLEDTNAIYFSWERFNRTTSTHTVAMEVSDILQAANLPSVSRSNTDRVAGWTKIYSLLDTDDLFVLEDNEGGELAALAEAIPLLVRGTPPQDIEDVIKAPGVSLTDDLGDALRYAVAGALLDGEAMPAEEKERRRLAGITDQFTRYVEMYKAYNIKNASERRSGEKPKTKYSWQIRLGAVPPSNGQRR